jgi:hypothetical protein
MPFRGGGVHTIALGCGLSGSSVVTQSIHTDIGQLKRIDRKSIAELFGVTAVVASLIFVGFQVKQTSEIRRMDYFNNALIGGVENRSLRHQHADIWFKGNGGASLEPVERMIYLDLFAAEFARVLYQSLQIRASSPDAELTVEIGFAGFLFRNPGARSAWEESMESRNRYIDPLRSTEHLSNSAAGGSKAFIARIQEYLQKLDILYPDEIS